MNVLKKVIPLVVMFPLLAALTVSPLAYANAGQIQTGVDATGAGGGQDIQGGLANLVNALLFVIGAVAVIMLIIGGIRYVISQGDSSAVQSAKNTILYAVIGLLVAIFAYAIVNFVITSFTN